MRRKGSIKFFNKERGFGFVAPEEGNGKDIFIHITALLEAGIEFVDDLSQGKGGAQVTEGSQITFETRDDSRGRGPQAVNIELA